MADQIDLDLRAVLSLVHALGAQVVLDVARPLRAAGVHVALELVEDLPVGLAHDVGQHVEPAAVGHGQHGFVQAFVRGLGQDRVQQRDQRLRALQREPALTHVLGLQEHLERLGHVQPGQDAQLLVVPRPLVRPLDAGLDPGPLVGLLDVHVLHADGPAVRVAQHAEDLAQLHQRLAAEAAGGELPLQVPQGQPVLVDVQVGVLALRELQRVGVGHEVAAHPVGVDQLLHPGRLGDVVLVPGGDVPDPADRLVRDLQRGEDVVEETVVAQQQLVDSLQELTGLRALDDPVVVGRGHRDLTADGQPGQRLFRSALVGGRVLHRADPDDRALAGHQPGDGVLGADRARVGQADRGAGEVLDGQLAGARLAHHVLVRGPELPEVHGLGALDVGHQELTRPVVLGHVDGQAQVDVLGLDQHGLAVVLGERVVHRRDRGQRADHRVADQVGERDLAAATTLEVVVDHDAVVDEQLGRDVPDAGRGGHGQAAGHVDRGAGRRAAQPVPLTSGRGCRGLGRRGGRGSRGSRGRRGRRRSRGSLGAGSGGRRRSLRGGRPVDVAGLGGRSGARRPVGPVGPAGCGRRGGGAAVAVGFRCVIAVAAAGAVVGEEAPPRLVHRAWVRQVTLVQLIYKPLVGAEVRGVQLRIGPVWPVWLIGSARWL